MPKPRTCPHCLTAQDVDDGLVFSDNLGLTCGSCGKVMFPTSHEDEAKVDEAIKARNTKTYPGYDTWRGAGTGVGAGYDHTRTSYGQSGHSHAHDYRTPGSTATAAPTTISEADEM